RSASRIDRLRLHRSFARGTSGRRTRHKPGLAPGAREVRLPMDRRRSLPHQLDQIVGTHRPLPARATHLVGTEDLGPREASDVEALRTGAFKVVMAGRKARPCTSSKLTQAR